MSTEGPLRSSVSVPVPKPVTFTLRGTELTVTGPLGSVTRPFPAAALAVTVRAGFVELALKIPANRKRAQALLSTWERHLENLSTGVTRGFEARMKVVAAHFPMKVQVKDRTLLIENFLGEKHPRSAELVPGVVAKVEGDVVVLTGYDVELVGQSAANIERATRIRDYDPRVFQDGIYIIERARPTEARR